MKPRVLFAGLFHETNTFVREPTRWADFEVTRGQAVWAKESDESPTAGFLSQARCAGWDVVISLDARAMPGTGTVENAAFEQYWTEFEKTALSALADRLDAFFFVLHGAMVTETCDDVEGEFLRRVRRLPGASALPVFGVFDLHANVTAQMCANANCLVAYRRNPHSDAKAAAIRAARLLERCLKTGKIPRMSGCRVPIIWTPPETGTADDPMRSLVGLAERSESENNTLWCYNVAPGFSFSDTAETGLTLTLAHEGHPDSVRPALEAGARMAWAMRSRGAVRYPTPDEFLSKTEPSAEGPVLLVEPADNIGGGGPGDVSVVLRAFLAHRTEKALAAICDPRAVESLREAAVGSKVRLAIGGRGWHLDPGPVELDVTFLSRSNGTFTLEDPQSHLASVSGLRCEMGPCAVVRCGGVTLLLTSRKTMPFDLGQFRSQGIEPRDFHFIDVKAAVGHRQAYDSIGAVSHFVDTPGPCSNNVGSLPYVRLRRPVYPIDSIDQPSFIFY